MSFVWSWALLESIYDLVDTGVWVDYFNGNTNKHTDASDAVPAEDLVVM